MAQYVLGEEGARKFKQLTQNRINNSNGKTASIKYGAANTVPHPFQIQWASSSGEKNEDGSYTGTYIIWLPPNAVTVNGVALDTFANVKFAENYNNDTQAAGKWFDLSPMLKENDSPYKEWPKSFAIYLDYFNNVIKFRFMAGEIHSESQTSSTDISRRILIASIRDYKITHAVESHIVVTDTNMPFDVVTNLNGISADGFKITRPWFYVGGIYQTLEEDSPIPKLSTLQNAFLVADVELSTDLSGDEFFNTTYKIEYTDLSSVPKPLSSGSSYWKQLYTLNGQTGATIYDYRNAEVELNWLGTDNKTISYGDDGQRKSMLHLNDFYNLCSEISNVSNDDYLLIRKTTENRNSSTLKYIKITDFKDSLQNLSDDNDISSKISVDNCSISYGGDSNLSNILHLYDFHNTNSNTTTLANSDIVLRTPYSTDDLLGVTNKLEYIPYDDFEALIDTWISSAIENALGEEGEIKDAIDNALSGLSTSGGSSGMFAWDEKTKTMGAGGCMVGRQWFTASNTGVKADGFYSLNITLNGFGGATCTVVSNATLGQAPTDTQCWIPIYQITDGKIVSDYRGAFVVPAYD